MNKIIKILDEKTIIIDYGSSSGAKVGEKVRIYLPGEDIIYNDKNFGNLNIIKDELEIIRVYSQFSICQKIVEIDTNPYKILSLHYTQKKIKSLNIKKDDITKIEYETNEPIKIGDLVEIL